MDATIAKLVARIVVVSKKKAPFLSMPLILMNVTTRL